jgi:hypothetical protein
MGMVFFLSGGVGVVVLSDSFARQRIFEVWQVDYQLANQIDEVPVFGHTGA